MGALRRGCPSEVVCLGVRGGVTGVEVLLPAVQSG